ncbi:hypothetical protein GOODEAATRI_020287 [Goodea atripinnis]|uniref:Uncharacterized protein n=1 Tax=Goodea atripinnis TaxID=208336 RepID=A0ABV0NXY1_9TELE
MSGFPSWGRYTHDPRLNHGCKAEDNRRTDVRTELKTFTEVLDLKEALWLSKERENLTLRVHKATRRYRNKGDIITSNLSYKSNVLQWKSTQNNITDNLRVGQQKIKTINNKNI